MASTIKDQFSIPKKYNTLSIALMLVGLVSVIVLLFTHGLKSDQHESARFWASLLYNSVYFLLTVNAAMFFICATTLMWGGWQMSFRRVTEAISTLVPIIGLITFIILMVLVFGDNHTLYHWADTHHAQEDPVLAHKSSFLDKTFFTVWSVITIGGWWLLGKKMRQLSRKIDDQQLSV